MGEVALVLQTNASDNEVGLCEDAVYKTAVADADEIVSNKKLDPDDMLDQLAKSAQ